MAGKRKVKRAKKQKVVIMQQPKTKSKPKKAKGPGPMETAGNILGKLLGGAFGAPNAGSTLGGLAGKGIGWITGTGDYRTNFDSIKSTIPSFSGDETTIITHREYLTDIYSGATLTGGAGTPTAFNIQTFPLQPGWSPTFSWLAQVAANYEEYDILGMVFCFKSTSGESVASANTTLGTVILATEYDATKAPFTSKLQMENYHFAMAGKPSESMYHAVECKTSQSTQKHLYIRTTAPQTNNDLRWSDYGNFSIATVGQQQANVNLGELWVTYKVKLYKPRLPQTVGLSGSINTAHFTATSISASNPLGTAQTVLCNTINGFTSTATQFFLTADPTEKFLVNVYWINTPLTDFTSSPTLTFSNATSINIYGGDTYAAAVAPTGSSNVSTNHIFSFAFEVTGNGSDQPVAVTFAGTSWGGNVPTELDFIITQLDSSAK